MRLVGQLLVLVAHSWVAVLAAANDEAGGCLAAWKSGSDKIWAYDVAVSIKVDAYSRPHKRMIPVGDHLVRQRFSHGMWRVDLLSTRMMFSDGRVEEWKAPHDDAGGGRAFAYSGEGVVRFLSPDQSFAQVMPVVEYNPVKVLGPQLFEAFKAYPRGASYFDLLSPRVANARVETSSGRAALRLPRVQNDMQTAANIDFEVLLNTDSDHLPSRIGQSADILMDPPFCFSVVDNVLTEVLPQVWCPTRVTESIFAKGYRENDLEAANITVVEVDVHKSRFNIDIPIEVFELKAHPGVVLYDTRTGENYVETPDGDKDYAAYRRQIADQVGSQKGASPIRSERTSVLPVVVIVNVVLLIAISVLVVVRRRSA